MSLIIEKEMQQQQNFLAEQNPIKISELKKQMGWVPDYPDIRDYTFESEQFRPMAEKLGLTDTPVSLPTSVDLRPYCSPIENQGSLGSCTAHAGIGMMEYYEKRAFGKHIDASRLFLYKVTRNLLHWTGDTGAYLRTTMGAMAIFGAPPESYYPYNIADYNLEPPAFCYSFAQNYNALNYLRLDPAGKPYSQVLQMIKSTLAAGLPSMFGFTVYDSINQANTTGKIPFPVQGDKAVGGHAIMAVGFDDSIKIKNIKTGYETTGAFIIRNSWGTSWGNTGYGYLPYQYVLSGLAKDWWILIKQEWVDTNNFGL